MYSFFCLRILSFNFEITSFVLFMHTLFCLRILPFNFDINSFVFCMYLFFCLRIVSFNFEINSFVFFMHSCFYLIPSTINLYETCVIIVWLINTNTNVDSLESNHGGINIAQKEKYTNRWYILIIYTHMPSLKTWPGRHGQSTCPIHLYL